MIIIVVFLKILSILSDVKTNIFVLLSKNAYGKHFLLKNYSLELLLILYEEIKIESIDELISKLESNTPKFPAFISYISYLEKNNCIIKITNEKNKSKRIIKLSSICSREIKKIFNFSQHSDRLLLKKN